MLALFILCSLVIGCVECKLKYSGMTMTDDKYCPNATYDSQRAKDSIFHLSTTGANYVSIIVTQYQMTYNSTNIFPIYDNEIDCGPHACITAKPDALKSIINEAHSLNMSVMLKPQIDLLNDSSHWRGQIGFGDNTDLWDKWFESYSQYILFYSNLSQEMSVELLSVSCELIIATTCTYCQSKWRNEIIPQIKSVFNGELTISANWADPITNDGELTHIEWWDIVDYIGCDEYYIKAQSGNGINGQYPTMEELINLWKPIEQQMESLHKKWNKNVIFTEIGYCSGVIDGTNDTCWCNGAQSIRPSYPNNQSLYAQYNQYLAGFESMTKYDWFLGFFWWNWPTDAAFGGNTTSCMTPSYKPTEELMREWYQSQQVQPAPPNYSPQCVCWE